MDDYKTEEKNMLEQHMKLQHAYDLMKPAIQQLIHGKWVAMVRNEDIQKQPNLPAIPECGLNKGTNCTHFTLR